MLGKKANWGSSPATGKEAMKGPFTRPNQAKIFFLTFITNFSKLLKMLVRFEMDIVERNKAWAKENAIEVVRSFEKEWMKTEEGEEPLDEEDRQEARETFDELMKENNR